MENLRLSYQEASLQVRLVVIFVISMFVWEVCTLLFGHFIDVSINDMSWHLIGLFGAFSFMLDEFIRRK